MKGKGERERYTQLNLEFQITARRDKKALSEQCKEIEKNNRKGKTRYLKKIKRYQGNSSCKDGHNKGQKWQGPNRSRRDFKKVAKKKKKRWQEYTEKLYKKDPHDPDIHNGEVTHLKPDILECEVKWALGSTTTQS